MSALDAVSSWPVPTAAAAVVGPSGIVAATGDLERQFYLASVTKPLTALAVLVAVEEEAVALDDPADESVVPGATLRHLLAHASGLAPERPMKSFPPATRRVYSNVGIERAADLVERATEIPFAEYAHEAVFRPLGIGASLRGSPAYAGHASVADLARVAHEMLRPSGLLSRERYAELRTVQYPGLRGVLPGYGAQDPNDWGLGFEVRASKTPHWTGRLNSPATFGHFGQSGTFVWTDPSADLALIALTDRDFGPWAIEAWPALADAVLGEA